MNVGEETAGTNGKFNCQLAGRADHTTRLPGILGPHRLTADIGVGNSGGEKGRTTSSPPPSAVSRSQRLSRCPESSKGQKSAPTAVRQVWRRKINQNQTTGTIRVEAGMVGQQGRGCCHCQRVRGAGKRPVSRASLRPKINSEK